MLNNNIDIKNTKYAQELLDLIRDIYQIFGFESSTIKEYIKKRVQEIYGKDYDVEVILNGFKN